MMVFLEEELKTASSRIEGQATMYVAVGAGAAHRQNPQEFLRGAFKTKLQNINIFLDIYF